MIKRFKKAEILQAFDEHKVVILYGARQVGKTTLAKEIATSDKNSLFMTTDDLSVLEILRNQSLTEWQRFLGDTKLLVIDEAQRVENIGLVLKLLHDNLEDLNILATGSSSFDLANKINEPLTGRKREIRLDSLSIQEVSANNLEMQGNIRTMLIRGGYPEVWGLSEEKAFVQLKEIATSYIFKDIFAPQVIYDQSVLMNLMRLLAYQIGSEVSYNELSKKLGVSVPTVQRYVDLLEKTFVIFRLNQYRKNQRVEVGRLRKVYFSDLGIRNAVIDNFKALDFRDDQGAVWENFCVIERMKFLSKERRAVNYYYWRNNRQQEIDLIEEEAGLPRAFEMKYQKNRRVKLPNDYQQQYPENQSFEILTPENFWMKGLE